MKTIAIANHKGGVGKTATAVNISAIIKAKHDKAVLLVDADAQANSTEWLTGKYGADGHTTYEILLELVKAGDCILSTDSGVDVLPANLRLASIDLDMTRLK